MLSGPTPHPGLLIFQFWVSTLRLILGFYLSAITSLQINARRNIVSTIVSNGDPPPTWDPKENVMLSFQLGLWIILISNDIYMAAFDFKRTNTYAGCVASQLWVSTSAIIVFTISLVRRGDEWNPSTQQYAMDDESSSKFVDYGPKLFVFTLPTALGALLSLCLILVTMWSGYSYRHYVPLKRVWRYNTKGLIMGTADVSGTPPVLGFIGNPRTSSVSPKKEVYAPGDKIRRFFTNLLLRRVNPVETRPYALARNVFSLVSIVAILFRAITALGNTHTQMGTRMITDDCENSKIRPIYTLDLLVVHNGEMPAGYPLTTITMDFNGTTENCIVRGNETDYRSRIFGCSYNDSPDGGFTPYFPSDTTFRIDIRSADDRLLGERDMPDIWLLQRLWDEVPYQATSPDDLYRVPGPMVGRAAWAYVPPWNLRPGFHIEAEAQMVIRRFIQSSFIEELVFNSDPVYKREPLFPIVESGVSSLNNTVATATIRPTLRPGYAYLRDSKAYQDLSIFEKGNYQKNMLCTFIDDFRDTVEPKRADNPHIESAYNVRMLGKIRTLCADSCHRAHGDSAPQTKSAHNVRILPSIRIPYADYPHIWVPLWEGSALDVLGSIGGFYALLQSIHLLLFGRPMLWGLTGAKIIAPFGLLGMCSSRDFKRRLREQYHRQPTVDNPDTFLMGAFLRDFVVDIGPADASLDAKLIPPVKTALSTVSTDQREQTIDSQASLTKLEICQSPSLDVTINIEELTSPVHKRTKDNV